MNNLQKLTDGSQFRISLLRYQIHQLTKKATCKENLQTFIIYDMQNN